MAYQCWQIAFFESPLSQIACARISRSTPRRPDRATCSPDAPLIASWLLHAYANYAAPLRAMSRLHVSRSSSALLRHRPSAFKASRYLLWSVMMWGRTGVCGHLYCATDRVTPLVGRGLVQSMQSCPEDATRRTRHCPEYVAVCTQPRIVPQRTDGATSAGFCSPAMGPPRGSTWHPPEHVVSLGVRGASTSCRW